MSEKFVSMPHKEMLKYEVAQELGLMDKVIQCGWAGLSTQESGRVGGIVARKLKEIQKER